MCDLLACVALLCFVCWEVGERARAGGRGGADTHLKLGVIGPFRSDGLFLDQRQLVLPKLCADRVACVYYLPACRTKKKNSEKVNHITGMYAQSR